MDIVVSNSESLINNVSLAGPIKGQFLDFRSGQLWKLAAGETPGAFVDEDDVDQDDTLTAACDLLAKSNTFRVPLPAGINAAGLPRFLWMNLYNNGITDRSAFSLLVDVTTGMGFNPAFLSPTAQGGDVLQQKL